MSKFFKTMLGKSDKNGKQQNETNAHSSTQQDLDPRPFDVDFKNLGKYTNEELCEFIWQYEIFLRDLKKKYQALKQKIMLDDKERKRLTDELEQYKLQCQNLKTFIEQNKISGSNSQKISGNTGGKQQEVVNQKVSVDLDALLTQYISPAKILATPFVIELQNSFNSVIESTEELYRGFQTMEKVDFHEEGHHPKLEESEDDDEDNEEGEKRPKEPEEFHLVEAKVRQKMIQMTKDVQKSMEKSSSNFEGLLASIQEGYNQLNVELRASLDPFLKSPGNVNINSKSSTASSSDLGASASKVLIDSLEKQNKDLLTKCAEYERNIKAIDSEKKKLKKDGESKLTELRKQLDEQSKVIEDLINQNQLLENANSDIEDQVSTLKRTVADLKQKLERTEKELKSSKDAEEHLAVKLVKASEDREHIGQEMGNYIAKIESLNKTIADLEDEKTKLKEEIKIVRDELKNACDDNVQPENQNPMEVADLKLEANSLKEEIGKLQKVISAKDSKLLEFENKLIQERLKSEQIKRDLIRAEEALKETKTSLNDQINENHDGFKTIEHLENELVEERKKYRECKKNLKKTEAQLTKAQNQVQEEQTQRTKLEQSLLEQKTESTKLDTSGADLTIHGLSVEIRELTEKVEQLAAENNLIIEENKKLTQLYNDEKKELELLKEKREAGLKEIKRLNAIIESSKTGRPQLSQRVSMTENDDSGHVKVILSIKKALEALYKQLIVSIQYEKSADSSAERNPKSMRSAIQGFIPPDNVVRLEKKLNDLILYVREYLENINSFLQ